MTKEKYQWIIKNMQEMGEDVYKLPEVFYESYEEAVAAVEKHGPEFRVWCRFVNPGFIKREDRKKCSMNKRKIK